MREDSERASAGRVLAGRDDGEDEERDEEDDRPDAGRAEAARELDERDEDVERVDDERDEDDERELEAPEREPDERSVVECERVPRRVDSLELMARPPPSSSSDQIRRVEIRSLRQRQHRLCLLWLQLLQQFLQEHSRL